MPIFEYKCKSCGKVFEVIVFNDNDLVGCPECGHIVDKVDKQISRSTGFILKGDGWYKPSKD